MFCPNEYRSFKPLCDWILFLIVKPTMACVTGSVLCLQIPIVDDEMKKAAGEVKEDGKCGCVGRLCSAVERVREEGVCRKCVCQIT